MPTISNNNVIYIDVGTSKRKSRKKQNKYANKAINLPISKIKSQSSMSGYGSSSPFQNSSSLNDQYMREKLKQIEYMNDNPDSTFSNNQNPRLLQLENALNDQKIINNNMQRGIMHYLTNVQDNLSPNRFTESVRIETPEDSDEEEQNDGYSNFDTFGITSGTGGSDSFINEGNAKSPSFDIDENVKEISPIHKSENPIIQTPVIQTPFQEDEENSLWKSASAITNPSIPSDFKNMFKSATKEMDDGIENYYSNLNPQQSHGSFDDNSHSLPFNNSQNYEDLQNEIDKTKNSIKEPKQKEEPMQKEEYPKVRLQLKPKQQQNNEEEDINTPNVDRPKTGIRKMNLQKAKDEYKSEGGKDEEILNSTHKKTIDDATKRLREYKVLVSIYLVSNPSKNVDESLINNVKQYSKLKKVVDNIKKGKQ